MQQFAIGIDLGGTNIKAALVERNEGLIHAIRRPTDALEGPDRVIDNLVECVRALSEQTDGKEIAGIGIGSPGTINWERTSVASPPNFPGWEQINLHDVLQERLGQRLPVVVENDANVAGLGSAHYGAGRPYRDFIMVTLGTGVGGAIIYNNTIFRGSTGGAGEIGHMTIDYDGPPALSGVAGAVEAYLGQRFLTRHAREMMLKQTEGLLHRMAGEDFRNLTPKLIYDAAQQGDTNAVDILAWAGHKLGCVLGAAINLLDIRTVIVGGGISAAGDYILEPARKTMIRYIKPGLQENAVLIQETLGNEVGMLGAAHLIFEYLDTHAATPERT